MWREAWVLTKDIGVELGFLGSKAAKLSLKISRESYSGMYCRVICWQCIAVRWQLGKLERGSFTGDTMHF